MSYYRDQLEKYLQTLDIKTDVVLDIGGGQKNVKGRTKSWQVKTYHVLDLPEFNLEIPRFEFEYQADIIFCLEVFEYLIEPVIALRTIAGYLNPKGTAIISFPLIYPVHNEVEFDSFRYTLRGVERMAEKVGLKVKKVNYRRAKSKTLVNYYSEDGMKAAKGMDHHITGYIVEFTK